MKYLNKSYLEKLKNKQWYHQRFDGSPFYLFAIGESEMKKEKRKPSGTEADMRVCFFDNGKADWHLDMADIDRGVKKIIDLAKKDLKISTKLLNNWQEDEDEFQIFFDSFDEIKLKDLSDKNLIFLYKKYYKLFINRFTSSSIIDHFALGTDELIASMLRKEVGKLNNESDFTNIFSILTAPVHQSFINKADLDLLKIIINKSKNIKEIEDYQKKYFWLKNNYTISQILSVKYFEQEIKTWEKTGVDIKSRHNELKLVPKKNFNQKVKLLKKYKLSKLLCTLIKISEDFTWWQDERKKATYLNIYLGNKILGEMARRRKVKVSLTKFLVPAEVESWFNTNQPDSNELEKRVKNCCVIIFRDGYYIAIGKEVGKIHQMMFVSKKHDQINDIRGLSASVGRVIGRVKIINSAREINKVQDKDILVAVMTRPDYIVGMKKAAAIVTNEGGITCHAAIISRELGIPCIIGTKIATQVFKDGDLVEVNANHGWVRKVKK